MTNLNPNNKKKNINLVSLEISELKNIEKELQDRLISEKEKNSVFETIEKNKRFKSNEKNFIDFITKRKVFQRNLVPLNLSPENSTENKRKLQEFFLDLDNSKLKKFGEIINNKLLFSELQFYLGNENQVKIVHSLTKIDFQTYSQNNQEEYLNERIFPFKEQEFFFHIVKDINIFYNESKYYVVVLLARKLFELLCLEILRKCCEEKKTMYMQDSQKYHNFSTLISNIKKHYRETEGENLTITLGDCQMKLKRLDAFRKEANDITHSKEKLGINLSEFGDLHIFLIYSDLISFLK